MKPIIYFAGKIGKLDWRSQITDNPRAGADLCYYRLEDKEDDLFFNPDLKLDYGKYFYGGPFFVSCDHGCSHGKNHHGLGEGCGEHQAQMLLLERHQAIWKINHMRLLRADLIFAYINEGDCYGTLIEIGMAQTRKKKIVIGFGPNAPFDDLWMARQTSIVVYRGQPKDVWTQFQYAAGWLSKEKLDAQSS